MNQPCPTMHVLYGQPDYLSTSFQTSQLTSALHPYFRVTERRFAERGAGCFETQFKRIWSNLVQPWFTQPSADIVFYANDGVADLRRWKGERVLYWYDAPWNWADDPPGRHQWRHWLRYQNVRAADYVFAVSGLQVDIARRLRPGRENSAHYLPVGVDCDFFSPTEKAQSTSDDYKIPSKVVIGYLSYLAQVGNRFAGQLLMEAAEELLEEYDVHFLIVGFGPALKTFQDSVASKSMSSHFTFTGYVPSVDLPRLLAAMDICIDTLEPGFHSEARSETKLKQYMAMGRACVATAIGENCVDLENGACGCLVAPGKEALREGIASLINNPRKRIAFGQAARERAVSTYSWAVLAKRMADVILSLE